MPRAKCYIFGCTSCWFYELLVTHHGGKERRTPGHNPGCGPSRFLFTALPVSFPPPSSPPSSPSGSYFTPFERLINVIGLVAAAAAGAAQVLFSITSILQLTLLSASHEPSLWKSHTGVRLLRHDTEQLLPERQQCYRIPGVAGRRRTVSS